MGLVYIVEYHSWFKEKNIMENTDTHNAQQSPDAGQGEYQVTEIVIFFIKKHQNHRSHFFISCGSCRFRSSLSTVRYQPDTNKPTGIPNRRYVCGLVKVYGVSVRWSYIIGDMKQWKYYHQDGCIKASDGVGGEVQNLLDWDIVNGFEKEENSFENHNKEKDQRQDQLLGPEVKYEGNRKCTLQ